MKFIHFLFFLSLVLHVFARATESSESESVDSSRSSSSEELRYNDDSLEVLAKVEEENAGNSTSNAAEEVKDTETAEKSKDDEEPMEKVNDLEKFDEGLESDKKEYVQKRAKSDSESHEMEEKKGGNSTESLSADDMALMDQLNNTMTSDDEDMLKSNETVLGIDTFGAQGI